MSSFFGTMFELGSAPILENAMKFGEARHRLILSNIANADTPGYHRQDLDVERFQSHLDRAVRERRDQHPFRFELPEDPRTPVSTRRGTLSGRSRTQDPFAGPLRHDENDVSPEREMSLLAQNSGAYSTYAQLLKKEWGQIRAALNERPGA